jgi:hypothetical protein
MGGESFNLCGEFPFIARDQVYVITLKNVRQQFSTLPRKLFLIKKQCDF